MNSRLDPFLLKMRGISKRFPGVTALNKVEFTLKRGEVVGLIGENGAGKSTLAKILYGVYLQDEGEIFINGIPVYLENVRQAQLHRIAMIHQELNLAPNIDAAGNIFLGREPTKKIVFPFIDKKELYKKTRDLMKSLEVELPLSIPVQRLTTGQKQIVEIAKALSQSAQIIIMDEPTSSLSKKETTTLFSIIKDLKSKNISIIFITHRLNEVLEISDRIICLRDGIKVGEEITKSTNRDSLVRMMIGRNIDEWFPEEHSISKKTALEVRELKIKGSSHTISFSVRKGETLGFAGLVGSGRTEIMRAVFGINPKISGEILIFGKAKTIHSPLDAVQAGMGFVPEDRREQGLILKMGVQKNLSLPKLKSLAKYSIINRVQEKKVAQDQVKRLKIRTPSLHQVVETLSGGNQQKIVIGKWLALAPKILILDEPTRGIDVGSKAEVYQLIHQLAEKGVAIILISSELEEIIGLSDRVAVMHEGRIAGCLKKGELTEERILQLATGGGRQC